MKTRSRFVGVVLVGAIGFLWPGVGFADPGNLELGFDELPGGDRPSNSRAIGESFVEVGVNVSSEGDEAIFREFPPNENGSRPFGLSTEDDLRSAVTLHFVAEGDADRHYPRSSVSLSILSLGRSSVRITALDEEGDPAEGLEEAFIDGTSGDLEGSGPWTRTTGAETGVDLLGLGYVDRVTFEGVFIYGVRIQVERQASSDAIYVDDLTFSLDNCPDDDNEDQTDLDEDGIGDECDGDLDGDGAENGDDNCPVNFNPDQLDTDMDGRGDECSPDPDEDGILTDFNDDGVRNQPCRTGMNMFCDDNCPRVANPDQRDGDEDGLGDVCDPDSDGDGFPNEEDTCPLSANNDQTDSDGDGKGDLCDEDRDGDEVDNRMDNCPDDANTDQANLDSDAQGDVCDDDVDGDGLDNDIDNCPLIVNPDQPDVDLDGAGDACDDDGDNDGVPDDIDNCPMQPNADQLDTDFDSDGDLCDIDDDDDGFDDFTDNCPFITNTDQSDTDGDNEGDACDDDPDGDSFVSDDNCPQVFNPDQTDTDGDGIGDACSSVQIPPEGGGGGCCAVLPPKHPEQGGALWIFGALLALLWVRRDGHQDRR